MTNKPIPSDFSGNLNSGLERHRSFVKAALERLINLDPCALNRDGKLYAIWSGQAEGEGSSGATPVPEVPAAPPAAPVKLLTADQAAAVFGRAPTDAQLSDLNDCLNRFSINTPARMRHFLAQVAHESAGLKWMKEIASGDEYDGRSDLGNTKAGDGRRYKGVGPIQVTGRFNYQRFADFTKDQRVMEGCDYVASKYPFMISGFWWYINAMNTLIDLGGNCRQVSARVNGRDPANGLDQREMYYAKAISAIPDIAQKPQQKPVGLDPRGSEEAGLIGPKMAAPVKPGDTYLLVNDRDKDMEAYDHTGRFLWKIPCLASGQTQNWRITGGDTPPGLYKIGKVYRDYENNSNPPQSDTAEAYGWYSFDLVELENQEAVNGRAGIMIHGGGTACGWPGAWSPYQALHTTLGCIRVHNADCRDKILPLTKNGTVYVGVFQQS